MTANALPTAPVLKSYSPPHKETRTEVRNAAERTEWK